MFCLYCFKCSCLVDGPKSAGAEHSDLPKLRLLHDPQQRLVRSFAAWSQRLHQLQNTFDTDILFPHDGSVQMSSHFLRGYVTFYLKDPAHLSLLQQAAQRPLPPDPSSPQQHKDYQCHDDSYQERPDHACRQRRLADGTVRAYGKQEVRVKILP